MSLPRLFVLAVGVSASEQADLRRPYAAADARAVAEMLARQSKRNFSGVNVQVLTDNQATKSNLVAGLQSLQDEMTSDDVGVIFFAGQETRDSQDNFYLLSQQGSATEPAVNGLSEAALKSHLRQTAGKLLLMLDVAVRDAGADETSRSGPPRFHRSPDEPFRDLSREDYGVAIIGSIHAMEPPIAVRPSGHGAFAEILLAGLSGQADADRNGTVDGQELGRFVQSCARGQTSDRMRVITAQPALVPTFPVTSP